MEPLSSFGAGASLISLAIQVGKALIKKNKKELIHQAKNMIEYVETWKQLHSFLHLNIPTLEIFFQHLADGIIHTYWEKHELSNMIVLQENHQNIFDEILMSPFGKVEKIQSQISLDEIYIKRIDNFSYHVQKAQTDIQYLKNKMCIDFIHLYDKNEKSEPVKLSEKIILKNKTSLSPLEFRNYVNEELISKLRILLGSCDKVIFSSLPIFSSILYLL